MEEAAVSTGPFRQAECLVAIQAHLANINGRLSAHAFLGHESSPGTPSDLIEL